MKINISALLRRRLLLGGIIICFFLSGAVALVYQTLWVRMFTIVFGNSSYAVSTVLSAFMAGLGLGSWYFGRKIDKKPENAVLLYGILEIGIALTALALPLALGTADSVHKLLYRYLIGSDVALALVRFALAFIILIIPTTLMGGTLPVLTRFFVRSRERVGDGVGKLYAANTFGAVAGCFLAGFYFIGILGVSRTMEWNVLLNLSIGLVSILLYVLIARSPISEEMGDAPRCAEPEEQVAGGKSKAVPHKLQAVLWFAALAGMTSLAYEVFWTRVLVFYMNNSIYAFTSMLTTLLIGIALGGYLFGKLADRRKNLWLWFAGFELLIGLWAIFAFPVLDPLFHRLADSSQLFEANFWGVPTYVKMAKSGVLVLFPTVLMGATFPLLAKIYTTNMKRFGRTIGDIYSRNTLGSMIGAFAAGFVLIPLFGIQKGVIVVAAVNIGLALAAIWLSGTRTRQRAISIASMAALAGVSIIVTPKQLFFRRHDETWTKLLFYEEDNTATVKVYELPDRKRSLSINGYEVAGVKVTLHEIQKALGHYPALLQKNPKTALVVGFGAGGTSNTLRKHGLERIDLVEIVPAVLKAAPYLTEVNQEVFKAPSFHPIIDDGRNYVHATDKSYDLISVDSIDPKHAGNGNLYTVEFYEDCLSRLEPGGIMAQWIPYHLLTSRELKIILKSFQTAFPHQSLWFTPLYNYFILVGSPDEIVIDYSRLIGGFDNPEVAEDLKKIGVLSPASFVSTLAMDEAAIDRYLEGFSETNTYDRPRIEFFGKYDYSTFGELPIAAPSGEPLLVNLGKTEQQRESVRREVRSCRAAAREMIKGSYFFRRGDYIESSGHWRRALALDPGNPAAAYMFGVAKKSLEKDLLKRLARVRANPNDAVGYFEVGSFYDSINDHETAIRMYRKAISLSPDFEQAYNNLGLIYGERGDYEQALALLKTAMEIDPLSLAVAHNIGTIYYLKGDYEKAEGICRKALSYPNSAQDKDLLSSIKRILQLTKLAGSRSKVKPS